MTKDILTGVDVKGEAYFRDDVHIDAPKLLEIGGDAIYWGPITDDNHVATKAYVDANAGGGGSVDTLWVGPDAPTDPDVELWYDTDEETGAPIDPVDHWNSAWGILETHTSFTTQSNITTTATELAVSPLAVTVVGGRRQVVVVSAFYLQSTAAGNLMVRLLVDDVEVHVRSVTLAASDRGQADIHVPLALAEGAHSIKATVETSAGTLQVRSAGNLWATLMWIEDAGPVERLPSDASVPASDWSPFDARYATKPYVDQVSLDVAPEPNRYAAVGGAGTTLGPNGNDLLFLPVRAPAGNIDALAVEVTTAGATNSVLRLGAYTSHPTRLEPYNLLFDAGTVSSTTTGVKAITFSAVPFTGGWLWLCVAVQGAPATNPSLRAVTGFGEPWTLFGVGQSPVGLSLLYRTWVVSASGALPNPLGSLGLTVVANPKIAYRIA